MMQIISQMPKISLHEHLDGCLRAETVFELAKRQQIELPASDPEALAEWFHESCTDGDLQNYLKTFALTVSVMQTPENLFRVAYEYVVDLALDLVIYAEVRWAPEQHLLGGLSMLEAVTAVTSGIVQAERDLEDEGIKIKVNQIFCAMRQADNSLDVAKLAVELRDEGVVGFDLAGPEDGFLPSKHAAALQYLRENYFPVTIHAGEEGQLASVADAVQQGALRLGHGTRLALDLDRQMESDAYYLQPGNLATWVHDRQITLECCPSSNLQTGSSPWGKDIVDHPLPAFKELGMRVTINCDNRLMSATNLNRELQLAAEAFDWDATDLLQAQVNAALGAFLPMAAREEIIDLLMGWGEDNL